MPLTDITIRTAKPGPKPAKLFDERGLFLLVTPAGGKWWRLKYRFEGKEKLLSLGVYPDVSLKDARERRDSARKQIADGIDPSLNRKAQKSLRQLQVANSFETVAREWYEKHAPNWVAAHGDRIIRRLERDIFPLMGKRPISDIAAPELLDVIRRIEARGALETAHRALSNCGQVFRYAVATGRAARDPSGDLRGALPPVRGEHFAAVTDPAKVGGILRALNEYQGTPTVSCALRLAPLVFVRPGELRAAEWVHIDLVAGEWRYTVTKTGTPHIVPLSTQAVEILREVHALTGHGRYVFPSARTGERPMSDNAILAAMRRMGIEKDEMSGHGFRAMARTILDEVLGFRPDLIEHQLAHAVKDPNGRAYNRTAHLPERRKMMQQWADYLDQLSTDTDTN
ncbi:integrase arm-type DNA-binding domain-containing protein [[Empedobacter] haloabium]|uniref:Integrase arm-type DNA-binding domain-containing protein n=1 Tax=[Empedobacter] haloabium TaxID=592317 RepID=A0ABZ1UPW5_9BURK